MTRYFYSPGQLSVIQPFLKGRVPKWLLLGGPADANEAQTAIKLWPDIRVVGVELNPDAIAFQLNHGWPRDHPLVHAALWDSVGTVNLSNSGSTLRHGQVDWAGTSEEPGATCPSVTWDSLDAHYGPFEDAVLWLDVEHSEWAALLGSRGLFDRKAVLLVNVEVMGPIDGAEVQRIDGFMTGYGFWPVIDWNASKTCRDRIYVRGDLLP